MTADLRYLAGSAVLAWVMLMTASFMRTRAWNRTGFYIAFGNRAEVPEPSPAAGRADRAARNMLENFALFAALLLTARAGGVSAARLEPAAAIFFWARLAYFPAYVAGIRYLRTLLWAIGVVAMSMVFAVLW